MTDEQKQEFTRRITNANKTEMIVILLEMVLAYTKDAEKALENQDAESFKTEIGRAKNCVMELQNSVNLGNDLAMNYFEIIKNLRNEIDSFKSSMKEDLLSSDSWDFKKNKGLKK